MQNAASNNWGATGVVVAGNLVGMATSQALADRVSSSSATKASQVNQRAALVAGGSGFVGIALKLLGLYMDQPWADHLGTGLLTAGTGIGTQLGTAYVDEKLGYTDPGPSPRGFTPPPAPFVPPPAFVPAPAMPSAPTLPNRLATTASFNNAL